MNAASNRLRRTHPTTLYWRSMRRVERRAARVVDLAHLHAMRCVPDAVNGPCLYCAHADRLLLEAVRTTNHLAREA